MHPFFILFCVSVFFFSKFFIFFGFSLRLIATELVLLIVQPSGAKSLYFFLDLIYFYRFTVKKKKVGRLQRVGEEYDKAAEEKR